MEVEMRINYYEYKGVGDDLWHFNKIKFDEKINLLVGDTGTGKTRILNTLFNLSKFASNEDVKLLTGYWDLTFLQNGINYRWILQIDKQEDGIVVTKDIIKRKDKDEEVPIVERDESKFIFCGSELPKLPRDKTSVTLLREENEIKPIHDGFNSIKRRRFSEDELQKISLYQAIPKGLIKRFQKKKDINNLFNEDLQLNAKLFFLMKNFTEIYEKIIERYKEIFPFIEDAIIQDINDLDTMIASEAQVPVFSIMEKGVNKPVQLSELSSGMQKVLLILSDIYTLPRDGGIYLVDEYENSLGINSIDFLPTILFEEDLNSQFIITSHHPYIINNFPISSWFVFHRSGSEVFVKYGDELVKKFGKSKQEAFIKLINDPFYKRGVEYTS